MNIVQGTNTETAYNRNNGVYLRSNSKYTGNTIDVKSGVTIGTASAPMKQNGIYMDLRAAPVNAETTHAAALTNAATIHARRAGIRLDRLNGGPSGNPTTITNSGAVHAGVGNAGETVNPASPHNAPHGITSLISWTAHTGPMTLTNSGDITVSGAYTGIFINYWGGGNFTATNSGAITATASGGTGVNLDLNSPHVDNVSFTNTGDVTAGALGLRFARDGASTGTTMFDNSGDVTVTGAAGTGVGHAVWLPNAGTRTSTISGAFTIENSGVLRSKNHALYATMTHTGNADALTLTNTGSAMSEDGDGIRVERAGTGALILESGAAGKTVSGGAFGIYASHSGTAGTVSVTHTAGAVGGRTGILAEVARASAQSATRATNQPLLDVTWTDGTFTQGTRSDTGRFAAASVERVIALDQEAAAQKAVAETVRYGAPAGIEARVLSWSDVVEQVATGDDPGAIADNTAQMNLLSQTHASSRRTAILAQFRAALRNDEIAVAAAVLTDIDSTATSVDDLSDAEIVTYLSTDNAATRTLLRSILASGLSEKEQAVLKAVATNEGLDPALDDTAASFGATYKAAVKALLNRRHLDDLRVAVNGGSIVSRGDGVRAYYVTPNDANGGIDVTIAAGVTVTGGAAGVYVANAGTTTGLTVARKYRSDWTTGQNGETDVAATYTSGPAGSQTTVNLHNQLVTVSGTVTGGTDAGVHLTGGGVLVLQNAEVNAGSSGMAILAKPGPALVYVDGEVKGADGGDAAVHLTGGGSVTVGPNGKVSANGADYAIRGSSAADTPTAVTVATDGAFQYKEDVTEQVDGRYEGVAEVVFRIYDQSGAPTSTSTTLQVMADGWLNTSAYPWKPVAAPDPTTSALTCPDSGRCAVAVPAGTVSGRTGVYAVVPDASAMGATRAAQPRIDVTWAGTFAHEEGSDDDGRFEAVNPVQVVAFDQTAAAGQTVRFDRAAGIEARLLSWREAVTVVAAGDDPGEVADAAAQTAAVPTGATAGDNAYVKQFKAAMENGEIAVDSALLSAIDTDGATGLSDAEIVAYLRADDVGIRALLQNVLAQGLSDDEKAVLRAVASGDDAALDAALTAAGFTDDANDDEDYWSKVKALRDRYHVDDIRVAVNGGSIDSRGDGVRAYYATPNANNGAISVSVAAGASVEGAEAGVYAANAGGDIGVSVAGSVTGGTDGIHAANAGGGIDVTIAAGATVTGAEAGIHVADAGEGLMLARKYTARWRQDQAQNGEDMVPAEYVAVAGGVTTTTSLLNQLVTVSGTVTGGTDAAVHLSGGGAVLVMEGGKVHAGSSGVAILVNDPGPALVHVGGEVRGGAGGAAAVHLTGGGSVTVGLNGRVEANGADHAIQGGGTAATGVEVVLATAGMIQYQDEATTAVNARVDGSLAYVDNVRIREYQNNVLTGYSMALTVASNGRPDVSGLPQRPVPVDPTDPVDPPDPTDPGMGGQQPPSGPAMTFEGCRKAVDGRCRLYEALPSMLVAMNELPSWAERTSAARDANGAWARVEASRGEWEAKKATLSGKVAYDHRRSVGRAGVDFAAGENGRWGVSAHGLAGKAEMAGVGEVELSGMGLGASVGWLVEGLYVDVQAAATLYDVDVESHTHGKLPRKDVGGAGYALGVDVGQRMSVGGMFVTPRAGVAWSKVELDDFTDMETAGGPRALVSVEGASSVKGRLGVMVETEMGMGAASGRLFGSLDVEREFSDETEAKVGGEMLKTEVRPTAVRVGAGGVFQVDENVRLRAVADYRASGSGTSGYGGELELQVRF